MFIYFKMCNTLKGYNIQRLFSEGTLTVLVTNIQWENGKVN